MIPPKQNAEFVYRMERVLDVYKRSYDPKFPVLCLDETSKQLVSEKRKATMTENGTILRDYEYKREGVCDIYMVNEPLTGQRFVSVEDCHNRLIWAKVVADVVQTHYTNAVSVTIVQDNLSAHKPSAFYEIFPPEQAHALLERIEFVHTPPHGSWLNMAEIELSILARQCTNRRIASKQVLHDLVTAWQQKRNALKITIDWQFTTTDARIKLKHLYPTLSC